MNSPTARFLLFLLLATLTGAIAFFPRTSMFSMPQSAFAEEITPHPTAGVPVDVPADVTASTPIDVSTSTPADLPTDIPAVNVPATAPAGRPQTCDTSVPNSPTYIHLPGNPFSAIPTADGCWIFVSLYMESPGIAVLHNLGGGNFSLVRVIPLKNNLGATGMTLAPDGATLIATTGSTTVAFLNTENMISGNGNPVVGYWDEDPAIASSAGTVYVNVTTDNWVFVSEEGARVIAVIDLATALSSGFQNVPVSRIPTGQAPIALTFSPDQRLLYTTSQRASPAWNWPLECSSLQFPEGAIMIVDVELAKSDPAHSVVATVPAGCSPVRLALSQDGRVAYVSARLDNQVLAFDTAKLVSNPGNALLVKVPVGSAPVGVAVLDQFDRVVVANSNRFDANATSSTLSVINVKSVADKKAFVIGTIPTGAFPRELKLTSDGKTLLVTNFTSKTLELVDVSVTTPPPVISAATTTSITATSTLVSWTTDVPATSQIEYGTTTSYTFPPITNTELRTSHQILLDRLFPNTTYHYRVRSADIFGRERIENDSIFTTNDHVDPLPPTTSRIQVTKDVSLMLLSDTSRYTLAASSTFYSLDFSGDAFSFDVRDGASITLISPDKKNLTNSLNIPTTCEATRSVLTILLPPNASSTPLTVTPVGSCSGI